MIARIFRRGPRSLSFSKDLPEEERSQLLMELVACAKRQGGTVRNARRAQALTELFKKLSPQGRQVFVNLLQNLNGEECFMAGDQYAEIEEAELFGGSDSKLAIVDLFETPRRRVLKQLTSAGFDDEMLLVIKALSNSEMENDIDEILAGNS